MTLRAVLNRAIYLAPVLIIIVLGSWALSSPVGSSPDDDFHLTSIWCLERNIENGKCQLHLNGDFVEVPSSIARAGNCFKHQGFQSAACQKVYPRSSDEPKIFTNRFNKGLYPSIFYNVMGVFSVDNILYATTIMRIFNVLLLCLLLTSIYVLGDIHLRTTLTWTWLTCSVPMGLFLFASNNPSSWSIMSIGCLLLSAIGYLQSQGRVKILFAVITLVCCVMAIGSRTDSAIYAVITLIVAALLAKKIKFTLKDFDIYFFLVIAAFALITFLNTTQGQSALDTGLGVIGNSRAGEEVSVFWYNFVRLPELWFGGTGIIPLGWLDTPMPSTVYIAACAALFIILAANISEMSARKIIAVAFLILVLTIIPLWVLMQSLNLIPENTQPRYVLPLVYLLVGTIVFQKPGQQVEIQPSVRLMLVFLLSISHSLALYTNIRRYVAGLDVADWSLNMSMEWWNWPQVSPMALWSVASLSFLILIYILIEHVSIQQYESYTET
jgi:hypothetical protein